GRLLVCPGWIDALPGAERRAAFSGRFRQAGPGRAGSGGPPKGPGDTSMALMQEVDYGTPRGIAGTLVTLEIDGKPITVPAGTSVMRAAVEAGVQVPKLCATDSVKAFGSCRLCLVEIDGRRGTPASCTTPAE